MIEILKFVFGGLAGSAVIVHVVRHLFQWKRYVAEVRRKEIENDGLVANHWKDLYDELKKVQHEQAQHTEQLIRDNKGLVEKCDELQRQIENNPN